MQSTSKFVQSENKFEDIKVHFQHYIFFKQQLSQKQNKNNLILEVYTPFWSYTKSHCLILVLYIIADTVLDTTLNTKTTQKLCL